MEVESAPATLQSFGLYGGGLLVPMGNFLPGRANQIWWARGTEDKHNAGYKWALAFDNQNFQGNQGRKAAEWPKKTTVVARTEGNFWQFFPDWLDVLNNPDNQGPADSQ